MYSNARENREKQNTGISDCMQAPAVATNHLLGIIRTPAISM
jgi:hypothetical protein